MCHAPLAAPCGAVAWSQASRGLSPPIHYQIVQSSARVSRHAGKRRVDVRAEGVRTMA